MFVDISKNGKYRRVLLRTSFREGGKVKHKTISNLSSCTDAEVEAIRLALKHKDNLAALVSIKDDVRTTEGERVGDIYLVFAKARQLGIVRALGNSEQGKLALWQVIARVVEQGSRLSAVRLAANSAAVDILDLPSFCEDDLYDNLAWLADHQSELEKLLFQQRGCENEQFYLYDVTSTYLEGTQNHFGAFGYNRDRKKGKMQIVIGLLCDSRGTPVSIEVFPGNTGDTSTFASQVQKLGERFGARNIALVGDRGMIKGPQIEQLADCDYAFNYITAISKPQIETLLTDGPLQMELFDNDVVEVADGEIRYILRRNPARSQEVAANRQRKLAALRELVFGQNAYLGDHRRAKLDVAVRKVREKIDRLGLGKVASVSVACAPVRSLSLSVDEDELAELGKLDGCYVIKTDLKSSQAGKQEVHDRYKDLAEVEWAFRTCKKTFLENQPVYVRTAKSTRGHVFVVMLGYLIAQALREDWRTLDLTVEECLKSLASLATVTLEIGSAKCQQIPTPNPRNARLLNLARVELPEAIPCRDAQVATRKKLQSERRRS